MPAAVRQDNAIQINGLQRRLARDDTCEDNYANRAPLSGGQSRRARNDSELNVVMGDVCKPFMPQICLDHRRHAIDDRTCHRRHVHRHGADGRVGAGGEGNPVESHEPYIIGYADPVFGELVKRTDRYGVGHAQNATVGFRHAIAELPIQQPPGSLTAAVKSTFAFNTPARFDGDAMAFQRAHDRGKTPWPESIAPPMLVLLLVRVCGAKDKEAAASRPPQVFGCGRGTLGACGIHGIDIDEGFAVANHQMRNRLMCFAPTAVFCTLFTDRVLGNAKLAGFTLATTSFIAMFLMTGLHMMM